MGFINKSAAVSASIGCAPLQSANITIFDELFLQPNRLGANMEVLSIMTALLLFPALLGMPAPQGQYGKTMAALWLGCVAYQVALSLYSLCDYVLACTSFLQAYGACMAEW